MADTSVASAAALAALNRSPPARAAANSAPSNAAAQALRAVEKKQTSDPALAVLRALTDLKGDVLARVHTLIVGLGKYEKLFEPAPKLLLQSTLAAALQACSLYTSYSALPESSSAVAVYINNAMHQVPLAAGVAQLKTQLAKVLAGGVPLPRASKDEMSNANTQLIAYNVPVNHDQQLVCSQLQKLVLDLSSKTLDVDILEANLDKIVCSILKAVHGSELIAEQELLLKEISGLEASIASASAAADASTSQLLSLALNSLQRLHGNLLRSDTEEEEPGMNANLVTMDDDDDDDDDDDCFFMPMPGAVKWAEPKRFESLAQPIGPDTARETQFVLVMEPEEPESEFTDLPDASTSYTPSFESDLSPAHAESTHTITRGSSTAQSQARSAQELVDEISKDMANTQMSAAAAVSSFVVSSNLPEEGASGQESTSSPSATDGQEAAQDQPTADPVSQPHSSNTTTATESLPHTDADTSGLVTHTLTSSTTPAQDPVSPSPTPDATASSPTQSTLQKEIQGPSEAAAMPAAGAEAAGQEITAVEGAEGIEKPEKLKQFVTFLNGENPGACMFHAQMRLSVEGCVKLANFLKDSHRVRALSLSHNYLGDEGLRLICEGLVENKSVTALDLPDNALGDKGMLYLVAAIRNNPSLTQLQLAYNEIGDKGAIALAEIIRSSNSLKKLGLSHNRIGKEGCKALTSAISANQSLKHLQILPGNPVDEKDAKALAKALKRNTKFSIRTFLGIRA